MSKNIPGNNKHLTKEDRAFIEKSLNEGTSFRTIAKYLCKDPSTISNEIKLHRVASSHLNCADALNHYNFCVHRFSCKRRNVCRKLSAICQGLCRKCRICNSTCEYFEREYCRHTAKAPYVCNGCPKYLKQCAIPTRYRYSADIAQKAYEDTLSSSRSGVCLSPEQLSRLDDTVKPLIEQGQSPYMIITNHPELGISVKTLYRYIGMNLLSSRNVDLKRKVKFKPRRVHKTQITNREVFIGRTYSDFISTHSNELDFWEMDTVVSAMGSGRCILTFYLPCIELFWARLLCRKTAGVVKAEFDRLQTRLGSVEDFAMLMPVILTDRGCEFGAPDGLEQGNAVMKRTSVFYCDPMRSSQKGGIENVHTMLRMIIPKGTVFTDLTQWDIRKCVDHMNNTPRLSLDGRTPYQMAVHFFDENVLNALQLRYVEPDKVTLSPKLLKQ